MKKFIIKFTIITLILATIGGVALFFVKSNNYKPLYNACCEFTTSEDTATLNSKITDAQKLYNSIFASETRLNTLNIVIKKLDTFEQDLNYYLIVNTKENKKSKSLSKSYSKLYKSRKTLIKNYNEYITRMSGNLNADGPALQKLYNELFNKTVDYIYSYNDIFLRTSEFVFKKVYKNNKIKDELYKLYSSSVLNLLNNISSNQFSNTTTIARLNNKLILQEHNIVFSNSIVGGEFSAQALNFEKHFNNSDLTKLINNFNIYYSENINATTETSSEKLAVYYVKQLLGL